MTSFTQGPLPRSIFFGTFTSVSELPGFIKSRVSLCQGGRQEHAISQGFFPPPFSFHFIACGVLLPPSTLPTQDVRYIFLLKILFAANWVNFLGTHSEEITFLYVHSFGNRLHGASGGRMLRIFILLSCQYILILLLTHIFFLSL